MIHGVPNDTVVATWHKPLDLVFFLSIMKIRIKIHKILGEIRIHWYVWNSSVLLRYEDQCTTEVFLAGNWKDVIQNPEACIFFFSFQSLQNCTLDAFLHCLLGTLPIMVFIEHILLDISKVLTLKFLVQKRSLKWKNIEFIFSLKHYFLYELNWFIVHSQICFVVKAASQSSHL